MQEFSAYSGGGGGGGGGGVSDCLQYAKMKREGLGNSVTSDDVR